MVVRFQFRVSPMQEIKQEGAQGLNSGGGTNREKQQRRTLRANFSVLPRSVSSMHEALHTECAWLTFSPKLFLIETNLSTLGSSVETRPRLARGNVPKPPSHLPPYPPMAAASPPPAPPPYLHTHTHTGGITWYSRNERAKLARFFFPYLQVDIGIPICFSNKKKHTGGSKKRRTVMGWGGDYWDTIEERVDFCAKVKSSMQWPTSGDRARGGWNSWRDWRERERERERERDKE